MKIIKGMILLLGIISLTMGAPLDTPIRGTIWSALVGGLLIGMYVAMADES